jgi:hypothetical protein
VHQLEKLKADSIRRAERAKDTIHSSIASQTQALRLASARNQFFPFPSVSLDKPFLIWATPHSSIITDSRIESFNSWAKILVSSSADQGEEKVSFYFLWENKTDYFAIIDANTSISATGQHLKAHSSGGWTGVDPTSRYSDCVIHAEFALWQWGDLPPTSTPYTSWQLGDVEASSSFWDDDETADISDGASLGQSMFLVPPGGSVVPEVALKVNYSNGYGHMTADFDSGAYQIVCPVVVVSVLTSQPG